MTPIQPASSQDRIAASETLAARPVRTHTADEIAYAVAAIQCPICGEITARRSHRRGFIERLRSKLTGKVPFRCKSCNSREWIKVDHRDL